MYEPTAAGMKFERLLRAGNRSFRRSRNQDRTLVPQVLQSFLLLPRGAYRTNECHRQPCDRLHTVHPHSCRIPRRIPSSWTARLVSAALQRRSGVQCAGAASDARETKSSCSRASDQRFPPPPSSMPAPPRPRCVLSASAVRPATRQRQTPECPACSGSQRLPHFWAPHFLRTPPGI